MTVKRSAHILLGNMIEIILSIVGGLVGGGGVGGILRKLSMGKMGNLVSGGIGGLLGGLGGMSGLTDSLGGLTGDPMGDAATAGAAGGGILTTIIGTLKNKFLNKGAGSDDANV